MVFFLVELVVVKLLPIQLPYLLCLRQVKAHLYFLSWRFRAISSLPLIMSLFSLRRLRTWGLFHGCCGLMIFLRGLFWLSLIEGLKFFCLLGVRSFLLKSIFCFDEPLLLRFWEVFISKLLLNHCNVSGVKGFVSSPFSSLDQGAYHVLSILDKRPARV